MSQINFPKLRDKEHAVLVCEVNTGVVLTISLERHQGKGNCHRKFLSFDEAEKYAHSLCSKRPDLEASIFNKDREVLKVVRGG